MNHNSWSKSEKVAVLACSFLIALIGLTGVWIATQQPALAIGSVAAPRSTVITDTIVYSRFISATSGHEVRFVNIDGTNDISITIGWRPRLSPDNNFIAFHHDGTYPSGLGDNLYVKELATQAITRVTNNADYIVASNWSTDSQHILLDQSCSIFRINRDGSNVINLTNNHHCYDDAPSANPLSGHIAFHNQFSGLYTMNADGSHIQHITNTQASDWLALWSKDGQWLSFLRGANYYKIRPDGTGLAQLTFSTAVITGLNDYNPDVPWSGAPWSSDDRNVIAPRTVNGVRGIYAVATDGSGAMNLVLPSPEGTWVDSIGTVVGNPLATVLLSIGQTGNGGGIVTANPSGPSYIQGTVITLTATPLITSTFTGWSGDASGARNPITVTMDANKAITATFAINAPNTYTLTVNYAGNGLGNVTLNPPGLSYVAGTVVTLTATPLITSTFAGWSGSVVTTTNPSAVTMTGDKTVTATFELKQYYVYLPLVIR